MSEVEILVGSQKRANDPPKAAPDGAFRKTESGLIVPAEISREREVWTWPEWRALEKATQLLQSRGVTVYLRCDHSRECMAHPIERVRNLDGGITLRCAHKDRVFIKGLK